MGAPNGARRRRNRPFGPAALPPISALPLVGIGMPWLAQTLYMPDATVIHTYAFRQSRSRGRLLIIYKARVFKGRGMHDWLATDMALAGA